MAHPEGFEPTTPWFVAKYSIQLSYSRAKPASISPKSGRPCRAQTFLQDGRVEIDSNRVENLIRPIALNRKNALFAGHDKGGIAWGRIASLIETCKINGIEPFAYLKATLTAIANGHPQSRLDDLLPWNFTQSS